MHALESVLGPVGPLIDNAIAGAVSEGIPVSEYVLDHVCYRVETLVRYEEMKTLLAKYGEILAETQIAGRPIATVLLDEPIIHGDFSIECVELPAPKPGRHFAEGWEHVECAVGMPIADFLALHPGLDFETHSLNKQINPEIQRSYPGASMKFHEHTLRYVVQVLEA